MHILKSTEISGIPNWHVQLADLTSKAWSDPDGKSVFPYVPLTTAEFWRGQILEDWKQKRMYSWVLVDDQQIVAHIALINRGEHWEIGRALAFQDSPHGSATRLALARQEFIDSHGLMVQAECTQAHTTTQWICRHHLRMRFAGIGVLKQVDGVWWDIIYFDNQNSPDFEPRPGILADPLGNEINVHNGMLARISQIAEIITTDRGGKLPPDRFHVLPELEERVRMIIDMNT